MSFESDKARHLGAIVSAAFGSALLSGLLLVLNTPQDRRTEVARSIQTSIDVQPQKKKPPKRKKIVQRKPPPAKPKPSKAPKPNLASSLAGLGVGLPMFSQADLSGMTRGMLSTDRLAKDMVMTESAVDARPEPLAGNPQPSYPPRARKKNLEGYVVLRMLITETGDVAKLEVSESSPPDVFDQSAIEAAQRWRFQPATYEGRAVKLWISRRVSFRLD